MSRGLGEVQQDIIRFLSESGGTHTTESLRWSLYEQKQKSQTVAIAALPTKWNTSFRRAIKNLVEQRQRLLLHPRPLSNLEECVTHYPCKTLEFKIRRLRLELLPALLDWTKENLGAAPRYQESSREEYYLKANPDRINDLKAEWDQLERSLREAFLSSGMHSLLELMCRARFLFHKTNPNTARSFTQLVDFCIREDCLEGGIASQLKTFSQAFFSRQDSETLTFKSLIHEFAEVPNRGECKLRKDTLEELLKRRPEYVKGLPGFWQPDRPDRWGFPMIEEVKYGVEIHRLFDKTVFQNFNFISLN